mmetsp:Transcript_16308/g.56951  ORF Transcript_16308/g.56951 Transcript_16308/m.56951 type:complete len:205 (-) Transcript_16308:2086-2700(-)
MHGVDLEERRGLGPGDVEGRGGQAVQGGVRNVGHKTVPDARQEPPNGVAQSEDAHGLRRQLVRRHRIRVDQRSHGWVSHTCTKGPTQSMLRRSIRLDECGRLLGHRRHPRRQAGSGNRRRGGCAALGAEFDGGLAGNVISFIAHPKGLRSPARHVLPECGVEARDPAAALGECVAECALFWRRVLVHQHGGGGVRRQVAAALGW